MLTIGNIETEWMRRQKRAKPYDRVQDDNAHRIVRDMLMIWRACADRRCKRARACAGDRVPGGPRCCADLDGEQKAWLTAVCAAFTAGRSWPEALCAGRDAQACYQADEEMRELAHLVARQVRLHAQELRARLRVRPAPAAVTPR